MSESRIRSAFGSIHADERLKAQSRRYIHEKAYTARRKHRQMLRLSAAMLCMVCLLFGAGGVYAYFTPTAIISIDINPSIELSVNRFDRVIDVRAFNDDGAVLAQQLSVQYDDFANALLQILQNESFQTYLAQDAHLSIVVVGENAQQNDQILTLAQSSTAQQNNIHCGMGDQADVETAHASGLSCGKYQAGKELMALDETVTTQDLQQMTMQEIHHAIESHHAHSHDTSQHESSGGHESGGGHGSSGGHGRKKHGHGH